MLFRSDGIYENNRIDLKIPPNAEVLEKAFKRINAGIAEMVEGILNQDKHYKGLYTSGGDITVAVCNCLGATGVELKDEVLPLAAFGKVHGGSIEGLSIITKGGMVGSQDALVKCVNYLQEQINEKG